MATLDNAIWINGSTGYAESGSTVISEGGNSTTVTSTFTANAWDETQSGNNVSDFGAFAATKPITADYEFSNPVEDLRFTLQHVSSSGTTFDDQFRIYLYDEDGVLIPAADIIAALVGVVDATVYEHADGSVVVEADNETAEDITVNVTGYSVSQATIIMEAGPDGTQSGGAGISDLTFTVPAALDYIVEGTAGNDTIDAGYTGDPEGDMVDNSDHSDGSDDDSILAGAGNDVVIAGAGNDTVFGGDGADTLYGQDGSDVISGEAGNDQVYSGDGADTVTGGTGDDYISAGRGNDSLDGGADNDNINGSGGADTIIGGLGNDNLNGGADADLMMGGDGADSMWGSTGNDTMTGGAGRDAMYGGDGDDSVDGGAGNDYLQMTTGNDTVSGGDDADNLDVVAGAFVDGAVLNVDGGTGGVDTDTLTLTDWVAYRNLSQTTDADADSTSGSVELQDGAGNWITVNFTEIETLYLPAIDLTPDYIVEGTAGNDTIGASYAGDPQGDMIDNNDHSDGSNADSIEAGAGDDLVYALEGDDTIDAGAGSDAVYGGDGSDTILGGAGNDTLDGDDVLALGGADSIDGQDGDDQLIGDVGDDTLIGGAGLDTIYAGDDNDLVLGGTENDQLYGQAGSDTVSGGEGADAVYGGDGADSLGGDGGNDTIGGDAGNDTLSGGDGADAISGDDGDDLITGGAGDDTITGGEGNDTINGGGEAPNMIAGGSFEEATPTSYGQIDLLPDWYNWNTASPDLAQQGGYGPSYSSNAAPSDGTNYVTMVRSNIGFQEGFSQDLATPLLAGETYTITLDAAAGEYYNGSPTGAPTEVLLYGNETAGVTGSNGGDVPAGAVILGSAEVTTAYNTGAMETVSITFTPTTDIATLSFTSQDPEHGTSFAVLTIDNISLLGPDVSGDDSLVGGGGDDVFIVDDGFGTDTIVGGETGETGGDTLDLSNLDADTSIYLTSNDPEAGSILSGGDAATFVEIENIVLGAGRDQIVLGDGSGDDTVDGFDLTDSGDGTTNDQLNVSGLTSDGGTTPVTTADVVVTDDGSGNAVLTFPGGESITLIGVAPTAVDDPAELAAIGIPSALDYVVEGTAGDDTINASYAGDPEGDMVDNNDHSDGSNDDVVVAGDGDDLVTSGAGDDTVSLGDGADTVVDGAGDDSLEGGEGMDTFLYTTLTGADTVVGGELNDTAAVNSGDKLNFHDGVEGLDITFSGDETGTVTGASGSIEFSEIEHVLGGQGSDTIDASASTVQQILDGGEGADTIQGGSGDDIIAMGQTQDFSTPDGDDDTLVLIDGFGNDSIEGFETPTDLGGGAYAGNDQVDVTGLTDASGNAVNVDDVTVTDTNGDGTGDAILHFPGGESITLFGISPTEVSSDAQLEAIGIPPATGNYIVEGTAAGELIDTAYTGDPDGDMIDNNDAADGSDDDNVEAKEGDDTVLSGDGNDSVLADLGDDSVDAGDGDDTVRGGFGDDTIIGGAGDDSIVGNEDNDSLEGGAGSDSLYGEMGNDYVSGGAGNDTIEGNEGDDTLIGGAGDDWLRGSYENDELWGGTGDDYLWGGWADDTFYLENDFGNDTIDAEGADETLGDTLDLSNVTDDLTVDLSNVNPETGTVTDGISTASFDEIEHIVLGGGTDTLVLADLGGADTVGAFEVPIDNGDGSFTGQDQLDVSALTSDGGTTPVNVEDVVVSDDGSGNAVLTFPGGESLTLNGVTPASVTSYPALAAMGIPYASTNYTVDGTSGADLINTTYLDDPQGDLIDNNDHSDGSNDDSVVAGAGDDTIDAGVGDDTILGGSGDDEFFLDTALQNDSIVGGETGEDGQGDRVNFSTVSDDITITFTGAEEGTLSDGTSTTTFSEIEEFQMGTGSDSVIGSAGDEDIIGNYGDDTIHGGGGNDTIYSGYDDDSVTGGDGTDVIWTSSGMDTVEGGTGDDQIDLGPSDGEADLMILSDGDGNDVVSSFEVPTDLGGGAYSGNDQLDVSGLTDASGNAVSVEDVVVSDTNGDGTGDAILTFPDGTSITLIGADITDVESHAQLEAMGIPAAAGDFIVDGTAAGEVIDTAYLGDPDGDMVDNNDHSDGSNDDYINTGAGLDTVYAGEGDDTVHANFTSDANLIYGEEGNDAITGGTGDDTIYGGIGDDSLMGTSGLDEVYGGAGNDTIGAGLDSGYLDGGDGDDLINGGGISDNDTFVGGAGNDTMIDAGGDALFQFDDGFGDDSVIGGESNDVNGDLLELGTVTEAMTVTYSGDEAGMLTAGTNSIDFAEIEAIHLADENDSVDASASSAGAEIWAAGGDDTFIGGAGDDTVFGEDGDDLITGGAGADALDGGAGDDTITMAEGDTVHGQGGDDLFLVTDLGEPGANDATVIGGEGGETLGDTLDFQGLTHWDDITYTNTDPGVGGGMSGSATLADGSVVTFSEIEDVIICFTAGTRIATPSGLRDVQDLRPGDLVVTRDNGLQPVRWAGRRTVPALGNLAPIRIAAGALGNDRALLVSPQHRMLIKGSGISLNFGESEVLASAKHLVNGGSVAQLQGGDVTYVHIMFDSHEIVYAEGAPSESFYPGDAGLDAVDGAAREELFSLFPELRSSHGGYGDTARLCLKAHEARLFVPS